MNTVQLAFKTPRMKSLLNKINEAGLFYTESCPEKPAASLLTLISKFGLLLYHGYFRSDEVLS